MLRVIAEQEHYLLVSDGQHFTVVERRAGRYYPLHNGIRHGLDLNDTVGELLGRSIVYSERDARSLLAGDPMARSFGTCPLRQGQAAHARSGSSTWFRSAICTAPL